MKKILTTTAFTCLILINMIFAQQDLKTPLPKDPHLICGKLANGITYYVRHNEEPKDQASFYMILNAGALLEKDNQNGLAHVLEHMAFNGTKNFPGKGIIKTLEKHGIGFGSDLNAYVLHNETVYQINSIPTTNELLLDTCLLILNDWSHNISLKDKEIDSERKIIIEEYRTRKDSEHRIKTQTIQTLFKNSQYAKRDVLGDYNVIDTFKTETLKDFYHSWHRPDLQAIVAVGDFDAVKMEQKIKTLFSKIPAVQNPKERPFFEIPERNETDYLLATDNEISHSTISITTLLPQPKIQHKNNQAYLKENIINNLYIIMINNRINELLQKSNPPFINASTQYNKDIVRGYDNYNLIVSAKQNEEDIAMEAILTENERIKRFGFTKSELERIKTNILIDLESNYKENKKDNVFYINQIQFNFLEQEPIVDSKYYYNFVKNILPTITTTEISAKAKQWNTTKNRTIIISGPSEDAKHLTKEESLAIIDKVEKSNIEPYKDNINNTALISDDLKGSKIIATKKLPLFNAEEWILNNGAKIVFCKANYENQVFLMAASKGGTSLYNIDMLPSAEQASSFANTYGISNFDAISLEKMLTGKTASCYTVIDELYEYINGIASPQDIETMFQLLYLRFEKPRFDKEIHASIMDRCFAVYANEQKNPQDILLDSVSLISSNYNPRHLLKNKKYLNQISLEKIEQVYRDRIKDASDFTFFIVGNIDAENVKPLVEKYIGSLKSENRKETWKDNNVRAPKGKIIKEIEISLETPKSTVITSFSKDMNYNIYNNICNDLLSKILDIRYVENIREKEGGTYAVVLQAQSICEPIQNYRITMNFDCVPERANYLKSLIYKEIDHIIKEGPTVDEVNNVIKNLQKENEQLKQHNSYWINTIYNYYQTGINTADPKNFEQILAKISPKNIQEFALKLFKDADVIDIIFKPKK